MVVLIIKTEFGLLKSLVLREQAFQHLGLLQTTCQYVLQQYRLKTLSKNHKIIFLILPSGI